MKIGKYIIDFHFVHHLKYIKNWEFGIHYYSMPASTLKNLEFNFWRYSFYIAFYNTKEDSK